MEEILNKRIKRYRRDKNLSQGQVAELLGRKQSTYAQMERKGMIRADDVILLSELFGVDILYLLLGEEKAKSHYRKNNLEFMRKMPIPKMKPKPQPKPQPEPDYKKLSGREDNIIETFRQLSEAKKQKVYAYVLNEFYGKEIY